jgi:hypothetical protein
MGSPISSTMAKVYLQYIEETHMEQWQDSKEIIYCQIYVDDIVIIYDQSKIPGVIKKYGEGLNKKVLQ